MMFERFQYKFNNKRISLGDALMLIEKLEDCLNNRKLNPRTKIPGQNPDITFDKLKEFTRAYVNTLETTNYPEMINSCRTHKDIKLIRIEVLNYFEKVNNKIEAISQTVYKISTPLEVWEGQWYALSDIIESPYMTDLD